MRPLRLIGLGAATGLLLWSGPLHAGEPSPVQAVRVAAPPRIDGRLDDALWREVPAIETFTQAQPLAGTPPTRRTELRLAHDGRMLYVALRAYDSAPQAIAARTLRRDAEAIEGDDHFTLVLDPQGGARHGFVFMVNALGAQRDGLVYDGLEARYEWDAVWDAAAAIDGEGWTAELAISLAALAVPADGRAWRINAERWAANGSELMRLHGAAGDKAVTSLADAGPLAGVQPERSGWGLRLRPTLRWVAQQQGGSGAARRSRIEPGLDALYQVSPGVTAALTLNADFADAEVDDRVVNLTRFNLFKPEKRAFFNQDAARFAFGGLDNGDTSLLPFFSRRVGLGAQGQALNLDAGLKLGGSAGPVEFGAFAAQVETGDGQDRAARVGVLRAATSLGQAHRVGAIATQGHPDGLRGSSLSGLDYQFRSNDVGDGRSLNAFVWALQSRNAAIGSGQAVGASYSFPNLGFFSDASWQRIDANFEPALGFVSETGVERGSGAVGWWHKSDDGGDRVARVEWSARRRLDGSERSGLLSPVWKWGNAAGDYLRPQISFEQDRLSGPYALLPGLTLAAGEHRSHYALLMAGTSPAREWSVDGYLRSGGFYGGQRHDLEATVNWKPSPHWGWTLGGTVNDIHLPARADQGIAGGHFTVRNLSLRLDHASSTLSSQSLLLQHDNVSDQWGLSLRARWTLAPGRDLLLALDRVHPRPTDAASLHTVAAVKLVWNWER
ncbi:carbohydrate binding family 9 domain-containing protein [Sphaerotilus sp.]|uniref:carbohydrate binding family 9 domain-containing protein n=1 Tax=Sphaerotilus sp. TaxID=2093942 RepID=UPI002ACF065E|nr:DUF5916 domain-containing protein [Sphaerotilus sp.]MDZ7855850.1 DUF5916 domain-containing protein [Sphaerotilus sp.]